MARKMVDFKTITAVITPDSQEYWHQRMVDYLNEGWEVFNSHFIGITTSGSEASFAYDLAKYEEESVGISYSVSKDFSVSEDAPKRRGRPPKAKAASESVATFEQHPVVDIQYNTTLNDA